MAAKVKGGSIVGDDDYFTLDKLLVPLTEDVMLEDGSFTLCFWIYLMKSSKPGIIVRQVCADNEKGAPFLSMDQSRKLSLHRLNLPVQGASAKEDDRDLISADQACPTEKWIHIGCEMSPDATRIHMDGVVVGEKHAYPSTQNNDGIKRSISLVGGDGCSNVENIQAYAHYVRVLPQPTVTNHYVKNPPLELSLDGSTGASDDHEVEEGGDGIWSVVGGKASCRRNFALDVVLLDALGRSIQKEMELIALLVYADNGAPVEKPKDDAEAPLLTTFDGVEFPSTERPIKLVHGRASFKLKISQLSSKCDNRLFRVCFDSPNTQKYPFLQVFSRPIRCVSRNRNSRTPAAPWKRPNPTIYPVENSRSPEEIIMENSHINCDPLANGNLVPSFMHGSKLVSGQPSAKRTRIVAEKNCIGSGNGTVHPDQSSDMCGTSCTFSADLLTPTASELHRSPYHLGSPAAVSNWPGNGYFHTPQGPQSHVHQLDGACRMEFDVQHGNIQEGNPVQPSFSDMEVPNLQKPAAYRLGTLEGLSDFFVFKYCLENMYSRASFLKGAILCKNDQELSDFAKRVSQYTGCHHNGYQIFIAKKLIQDGNEIWKLISKEVYPIPWSIMVNYVEEQFLKICTCTRRRFSARDKEFLRRIAGCGELASREEFDRLWQWIYPVALSLSNPQICLTWETEDPKWIEGMIFKEEAEALLKTEGGSKPGTFILRFASSRSWPHPDAGALVVSYVGLDLRLHHKLLSLDKSSGFSLGDKRPLSDLLLSQTELSQPYRLLNSIKEMPNN